jgi:squalene-hopene/tetraprenyl-beta-curcumene cyclase
MAPTRRDFLLASLPALAALVGCDRSVGHTPSTEPATPADPLERARQRGVQFLLSRQAGDGAWRSDVYGVFKDGTALTPLVVNALLAVRPLQHEPVRKAAAYLAGMARPAGITPPETHGFDFALYTSALTVTALSHPDLPDRTEHVKARDAWLRYLQERQLTEELGWKPDESEYGGWGYARALPRRPKPGELRQPLLESNLSATTFALDALRAAGVPADAAPFVKALTFVRRCQNWQDDSAQRDPAFDDGGFFFIYDDPVRNKAGLAGKDRHGRERFHSYGSTTADGLRCLALCGLPPSDPRRKAAHDWLREHFQSGRHPGAYVERHERDRMAVFYYYCASLARAPHDDLQPLARRLAEELIRLQGKDGSWVNPVEATRENEPLIATSFALIALGAVAG